jgi:flagellar hook-length control protein FliK
MQTAATTSQGLAQSQAQAHALAQQATAARLIAGAATGDFLSLLMQQDGRPADPQAERRPPDDREPDMPRARPDTEPREVEPDAAPMQVAVRGEAPVAIRQAAQPVERAQLQAPIPAAEPVETKPHDASRIKATIEAAGLESRPRAALSAGTAPVALAAQDAAAHGQQATRTDAAAPGHAAGEAAETSQRPDFAKLAKVAARGAEPTNGAQAANTTAASLDAQAEKAMATKTQTQQAVTQTGVGTPATPNAMAQPAQTGPAQAAALPQQAAEPGRAQAAAAVQAAGKPGAFAASLAGADAPTGLPGTVAAGKAETVAAPKPASAPARGAPQPAVDQVAVQIRKAAAAGKDSIQIRLNPAELGRVDVKLEFQSDGGVRAVVAVERPETLELLQRDARGLERALADAGFRGGQASLSFEMQNQGGGQPFAGGERHDGRDGAGAAPAPQATAAAAPEAQAAAETATGSASAAGGVDIRI